MQVREWAYLALLCAAAFVLTAYFYRLCRAVVWNPSEIDGLLLPAQDMVRGNWLLRGWNFASDSLWLTDMLLYAAGIMLRGLDPVLRYAVPALITAALVGAAALAAVAGRRGAWAATAGCLAVLPIVFPSRAMMAVLIGPYHTGATIIALASVVALHYAQEEFDRPRRCWALVSLAFILLTAGTFSDPYTVVLALAPIALASVARTVAVRRGESRRRRLVPLVAVVAAWYGAVAVSWWVRYFDGAVITPYSQTTLPYAKMGDSVASLVLSLLQLGGGDVFGRSIDGSLASAGFRFAYVAAAAGATWLVLRDEIRTITRRGADAPREEWLTLALATCAAVALAGNLLGTADLNPRYRLPILVMMSVVLARRVGAVRIPWSGGTRGMAAAAVVAVLLVYPGPWGRYVDPYIPRRSNDAVLLGQWLESHGLTDGYGGYWESVTVTVETRGSVRVRPVVSTKVHQPGFGPSGMPPDTWRLTRMKMSTKDRWYRATPRQFFVVFDPASEWDRDTGVDFDSAVRTYGAPQYLDHVGPFMVLVWAQTPVVTLGAQP